MVDDAIVVIENISRYIEKGEAAGRRAEGAGRSASPSSPSPSLIAVLSPAAVYQGDIVGRLFPQFAVTLAVAILISAVVS